MNIRVPEDLRARLRAAARRRGVSHSILVRSALEHAASSPPDLPGPVAAPVLEQGGGDTEFVCWLAASTASLDRSCAWVSSEEGFASMGASAGT